MFEIQDLTYADIWLFASHTLRSLFPETHLNSEVEEYRHLILAIENVYLHYDSGLFAL